MKTEIKVDGDCYDANGREFIDLCRKSKNPNVEYKMVHGIAINQLDGKPMGHAWIEATHKLGASEMTTCLDYSNSHAHSLSKETYYYIGGIKEDKLVRYTLDEFNAMLKEYDHWGHWELDQFGLPEDR